MPRRGPSDAQKRASAVQAARRMIAQGERPGYRLVALPDGSWAVDGLPGVIVGPASRHEAPATARASIAAVLEVPADAFDVQAG